jgi:cytochrome P450
LRDLLAAFAYRGGGDFISDVAVPYPCLTFLELLGLPLQDLDQLLEWKDVMVRDLHSGDPQTTAAVMESTAPRLYDYFEAKILEREAMEEPPDDLLTAIARATYRGMAFTLDEKTRTLDLFFEAGLDTVTGLLGYIAEFLALNPEYWQDLVDTPSLVPNAVEEFFRYFGIVTINREIVQDTELSGVSLPKGDYVVILTQAAGRDPGAYPNPERVDFRRPNIRHMGLGAGPHRCIGSHLARLELQIALEEMIGIMPNFSIDGDPADLSRHWGVVAGLDSLPLVVDQQ